MALLATMEIAPGIAGALAMALALLARRRHRRAGRRCASVRLHERKQASAGRALATLREIDPKQNPGRAISYLRKVDPLVFEEMILSELERRGHRIRRGERYSGDGGIDGTFWMDGKLWLIQAKRYGKAISREHVQGFGAVCAQKSAFGLFVHTGRTGVLSRDAERDNPHVRIISGQDLVALFSGGRVQLGRPAWRGGEA
jgi:restriction system protein